MATESLLNAVESLTPREQDAVREFIRYIKGKDAGSSFLHAADEFIADHPEILQRLAQ